MAIYKIFPEKSATLYSFYPALNTGIDEILELSTFESIDATNEVSRVLIKFPSDQISSTVANKTFDAYLKVYLANASQIPLNYTIYSHPVAADWNQGTGRLGDSPAITDGVSWQFTNESGSNDWIQGSFPTGITGSYNTKVGGGTWWTASSYISSQSFTPATPKDIELKVTNAVKAWYSISINNYGFIIKHGSTVEFSTSSK